MSERTHNLGNIDIDDLPTIRRVAALAMELGHWRRLLAIYADHLPLCAVRQNLDAPPPCSCGFAAIWRQPPATGSGSTQGDERSSGQPWEDDGDSWRAR